MRSTEAVIINRHAVNDVQAGPFGRPLSRDKDAGQHHDRQQGLQE
ncbi:hypothetical protein [Roseinatronobacter alkalisoli]|uniref:Uncharacterized protein n=1 Tax=Roseinatronobacter alkalisoli TaxID=3028235 RepID=A0ABT5TAN6_9RHOB|nr:hypothetical protein [Roseinatronobacter sp. HJB301]MDD7972162.1 hypothetical protein [Roseinatronobacter sp. HJB301]